MSEQIERLRTGWDRATSPVVSAEDIAEVVSMWTGVPLMQLAEAESQRLLKMEDELRTGIIGQEDANVAISRAVRRARAGLKDPKRPIGSFMFLGPTGVGKTELTKTLAKFMFGSEDAAIQLDMSEFMERHTASRLVGAPPRYIGYEEAGQLTEALRRRPYADQRGGPRRGPGVVRRRRPRHRTAAGAGPRAPAVRHLADDGPLALARRAGGQPPLIAALVTLLPRWIQAGPAAPQGPATGDALPALRAILARHEHATRYLLRSAMTFDVAAAAIFGEDLDDARRRQLQAVLATPLVAQLTGLGVAVPDPTVIAPASSTASRRARYGCRW